MSNDQDTMASPPSNPSDSGPIHDAGQYAVDVRGLEESYATLLQRWKEEQAARLEAEHERDGFKIMAHRLALKVSNLETQLAQARSMAQQLRAIL